MKTVLFVKDDGSLGDTQRATADMQRTVAEAVSTLDNIPDIKVGAQQGGRLSRRNTSKLSLVQKLLGLTGKKRNTMRERKQIKSCKNKRKTIKKVRKTRSKKSKTRSHNKRRVEKRTRINKKLRR